MAFKYVMANDDDGSSDLVIKEDISVLQEVVPALVGKDLWLNRETPADLSSREDPVSGKPMTHEPPDGGAVLRILDFLPNAEWSKEDMLGIHEGLDSVHVPTEADFATLKHPSMHKTDTLNYFVLLTGELWALSEKEDVLLKPGDVMIQKGCMHGWRNTGSEPARLFCVLVDSLPA